MAYANVSQIPYTPPDVADVYPESDGNPIAETERHLREIIKVLDILETHFADTPDVYIWSNMMMFYEKDDRRKFILPDIFVAFGIGRQERRVYKVWEEGKPPDFVMEFASENTYENDLAGKKKIYAAMGVKEYFLSDPYRCYLPSALLGFRLVYGAYVKILPRPDGFLSSVTLGLDFASLDNGIGIYDRRTNALLQTRAEREAAARLNVLESMHRTAQTIFSHEL